ncbi:MAG: purine-nucleoside phosphorylase [Bacteroidia bacterium]|nr:purine-nucleoside phosphorylase [Bacteroidia bacterium]
MLKKIKDTALYITKKTGEKPFAGIILGTGLGGLVNEISIRHSLDYRDIPGFPVSTVQGHAGKLIFGSLSGKNIIAMQGRFHYYEGWSMEEVVFPVRVMKMLGIDLLILSNASGGVNPDYEVGDIMILNDHINLFPSHPLMGRNIDELGPRFPDMSIAYDRELVAKAFDIARLHNIRVQKGVYAGVSGPSFETPSEYHYLRVIGADAVGMSTVPEVIAARHMNLRCFAMSVITDLGVDKKIVKITHEEVLDVAKTIEPKMTLIIKELLEKI